MRDDARASGLGDELNHAARGHAVERDVCGRLVSEIAVEGFLNRCYGSERHQGSRQVRTAEARGTGCLRPDVRKGDGDAVAAYALNHCLHALLAGQALALEGVQKRA